ncbi:hypothetical protein LTR37_016218 [Vermiconidia calcicola]|uniref:Uncharacterized protein n=1 Tax=Vermiconidia calcicola TaxID=1690605 RepID=A0ACC3MQ11_9PEZI|nr:hypothetical protein LTR37_016218 [Vermiconidia calcicola]
MAKSSAYELLERGPPSFSGADPRKHARLPTTRPRPWKTGVLKRMPWAGLLSILLAFGCGIAAISIALVSDGTPLNRWTVNGYDVQPAVLLSIVATIANAFLVFAFTQGATIHWWNTAFQGASLRELHSSYHYGSGLTAVFSSVATFNTVALAGIFMPVLLMDGPVLQRASSVVQRTQVTHQNTSIPISPAPLVQGTTGIIPDHASDTHPSLYHPLFAKVLQQYTNRDTIFLDSGICDGDCEVEILAPGWDIECSVSEKPYQLANYDDSAEAYLPKNIFSNYTQRSNSTYDGPKIEQTVFETKVIYNYTYGILGSNDYSAVQYAINLQTTYKSTPGMNGTLSHHDCWLMEAIVKYPLRLQNSTVTLVPMPIAENRTVERVIRTQEYTGQGDHPSTLGGFWLALHSRFNTKATIRPVGGWYSLETTTSSSSQYLRAANASAIATYEVTWEDPMEDMVKMANELAFRTAYTTTSWSPGNPGLGATRAGY